MLSLFSLLYLLWSSFTLAVPIRNLTALHTEIAPAWVASPSGRGTWELLYSCTFTIFLCVYTAIHLNIPPEESGFRFWLRKTKWVFIAVLAPEIVVYTSLEQWVLSRSFLKRLKETINDSTDVKYKDWARNYNLKCCPDMVYAQYAVMGGFAVDIQHIHNAITKRVTITTDGILFLARHGFFCQIRKDDIQDKSKADVLAKGLVCVQVLWIAGQAIERKIAGYPITLLEVHTLVHVVCAIVMYSLWVRKPLNVRDPTMVDFRDAPDILAFMVEISRQEYGDYSLSSWPGFRKVIDYTMPPGRYTRLGEPSIAWFKGLNKQPVQIRVDDLTNQLEIDFPPESTSQDPTQEGIQILTLYSCTHEDADGVTHYYTIGSPRKIFRYTPVSNVATVCRTFSGQASSLGYGPELKSLVHPLTTNCTATLSLSKKDILRLNSTAEFLTKIKVPTLENPRVSEDSQHESKDATFDIHSDTFGLGEIYTDYTGLPFPYHLLAVQAPNFKGSIIDNIDESKAYLVAAMAMIPAAYGCVHIGALRLIFPSSIERLLWKISCYYLIAAAATPGILGLLIYMNEKIRQRLNVRILEAIGDFIDALFSHCGGLEALAVMAMFAFLGFVALFYCGARVYIVVESFISLRHVPVGVYQSPAINFMNYVPHL